VVQLQYMLAKLSDMYSTVFNVAALDANRVTYYAYRIAGYTIERERGEIGNAWTPERRQRRVFWVAPLYVAEVFFVLRGT
jgi:hypothetical protein